MRNKDIFNVINCNDTRQYLLGVALRLKYATSFVDAQDLVQDTLVKAFEKAKDGKYIDQGVPMGWLRRIMYNQSVDDYRRKNNSKRKPEVLAQTEEQHQLNKNKGEAQPDTESGFDTVDFLKHHIGDPTINQDCLAVLILYEEGYKFKEIDKKLSIGNINTTLGRARNARNALKEKYGGTREGVSEAAQHIDYFNNAPT